MLSWLLKVQGLSKRFGGVQALSNLTFEVNNGEIFGIIGPNGAGKTTLFNVITGIYRPDAGEIQYDGRSIVGLPPHEICRLGIVKTYQIPRPFQRLTVLENLLVASVSAQNMKTKEAVEHSVEILKALRLDHLRDIQAGSLLPCQLKMLELARALACKPKLLLLDEPAAGLRGEVEDLIRSIYEISKRGVTIMLVEHRMEVVTKVGERIIVMQQGTKIFEGKPEEVLASRVVIDAYLGEEAA
jgi:branched-chain amino acid transport system ATP-binding protein